MGLRQLRRSVNRSLPKTWRRGASQAVPMARRSWPDIAAALDVNARYAPPLNSRGRVSPAAMLAPIHGPDRGSPFMLGAES